MSTPPPSPAPIIDCDLLEASKENIQPLPTGRRATALSAILSTPLPQREAHLQSIKAHHRANVQLALQSPQHSDAVADPLEAYTAFVAWTLEAYPQGQSADSGLLELLEEATRILLLLKDDDGTGKWTGELGYLKLWVLYAGYVERPEVVYRFLLANDVGTCWALLYEEFANVLERNGRRTEADEVYILGIARNAQPLDKLKNKHREFQKRMMVSSNSSTSFLPTSTSASASSTTKRTVLGTTHTTSTTHEDVFTAPTPNARLQVYVDPSSLSSQPSSSLPPETQTPYPDLGTRKTRIKENVPEVRKAGGTTLKMSGKAKGKGRVVSGSKIAVFRDEDEMGPPSIPVPEPVEGMGTKTPARTVSGGGSGLVPFRDEPATPVPAVVGFTPFRDEPTAPAPPATPSSSSSSTETVSAPLSVMKPKAGSPTATSSTTGPTIGIGNSSGSSRAGMGVLMTSEAEALRKDPLKNYGAGVSEMGE